MRTHSSPATRLYPPYLALELLDVTPELLDGGVALGLGLGKRRALGHHTRELGLFTLECGLEVSDAVLAAAVLPLERAVLCRCLQVLLRGRSVDKAGGSFRVGAVILLSFKCKLRMHDSCLCYISPAFLQTANTGKSLVLIILQRLTSNNGNIRCMQS